MCFYETLVAFHKMLTPPNTKQRHDGLASDNLTHDVSHLAPDWSALSPSRPSLARVGQSFEAARLLCVTYMLRSS